MKWFPLVALLLAGCGGKIITPYNFQVKDTLKGSPELIIKWPEHGRGQQSIHIMLKGSTRLYTTPILLHITIADDYQFTLCNPFVKRYYEIPFRLFSPPSWVPITVTMYRVKGFDIYGYPYPGEKLDAEWKIVSGTWRAGATYETLGWDPVPPMGFQTH